MPLQRSIIDVDKEQMEFRSIINELQSKLKERQQTKENDLEEK